MIERRAAGLRRGPSGAGGLAAAGLGTPRRCAWRLVVYPPPFWMLILTLTRRS